MFILVFFSLIKNVPVTGFVVEKDYQLLEIRLDKKFVEIKKCYLMLQLKAKDDAIQEKDMTKYSRFIQSKDEYKEYLKEEKEKEKKDLSESEEESIVKEFDTIYVDLSHVPKTKDKVYAISYKCIKKNGKVLEGFSRSFTYSNDSKEWVMADTVKAKSNNQYWTYIAIAAGCTILVLFGAYIFS